MGVGRRRGWAVGAVAAAVIVSVTTAMTAATRPTASAVAPAAPGQTYRLAAPYQPLRQAAPFSGADTAFGNVDYNGGPVMPSSTDYLIFWSPSGLGAYRSSEYVSGLEEYFSALAHDSGGTRNTNSVSAQYNDATGAFAKYSFVTGGGRLDTDAYPTSQCPVSAPVTECLTDAQIQHELRHYVSSHHLKADLTHEYFLLTPPGVEGCFTNRAASSPPYGGCSAGEVPSSLGVFCAYHSNTAVAPPLIYAYDPYVVGNSGCDDGNHPNGPSDGALEGGLSHELNESITDPFPNDAWTNGAGVGQGYEIGDQCAGFMGNRLGTAPNGAKYNQVIDGHFYWYQTEWSNRGHRCLQRLAPAASEPKASFTVKAGSGLAMTFKASVSGATAGVADYVWQFNDAFGAQTIERTTPTITHSFPATGEYSVGLTVFTPSGQSVGRGGIVRTGHDGLAPGFTFSPAKPAAGENVSFSGLTTVSGKRVSLYFWRFGDGSNGTGPKPTHRYAKAGKYRVTLVMYSGDGSAFPGAGAGPVVTRTVTVG